MHAEKFNVSSSGICRAFKRLHITLKKVKLYKERNEERRNAYKQELASLKKEGCRIIAPFCFKGTCNTQVFNTWIQQVLVPVLKPGLVVVMDHASFHKSAKTNELIESAGCRLIFLPPYSPDLNPIEKFWANFKNSLSKIIHNFKSLSDPLNFLFQQICNVH